MGSEEARAYILWWHNNWFRLCVSSQNALYKVCRRFNDSNSFVAVETAELRVPSAKSVSALRPRNCHMTVKGLKSQLPVPWCHRAWQGCTQKGSETQTVTSKDERARKDTLFMWQIPPQILEIGTSNSRCQALCITTVHEHKNFCIFLWPIWTSKWTYLGPCHTKYLHCGIKKCFHYGR